MSDNDIVGFIGLGVMGEVMCRNLVLKGDAEVVGYDVRPEPLARLAPTGVQVAESMSDISSRCSIVFLSLPAAEHVREICLGDGGLLENCADGTIVIDLSTVPPALAQELNT